MNHRSPFLGLLPIAVVILGFFSSGALARQSDNGNGTYTNPLLYADYSDPDIIRVGEDFYMVASSFVQSPGIKLLHSKDMVNWEFVAHIASTVDGGNTYNMEGGTAYENGFWAPSIRHHNGKFYVAVQPTFANGRIYYASSPSGPWNYYQLDRGIYDPGLFIDDDGKGYIICGHGPQSLMTLNADFSAIVSEQINILNSGGEGTHVIKRGEFYYAFNANPSVWPFQLRCSRAANIAGPWETGRVCLTATSGGHQGAIVEVNGNDSWFGFVHQDSGAVGRMPRIGPVFWEDNWPVFGTAAIRDQMGETYSKPVQGHPTKLPATSDDFSSSTMGLQWQWNHNPDNTRWSLAEQPGWLRLRPTQAAGFWTARNTLTQRGQGPQSQGVVKMDVTNLQPGDIAGFGTLGKVNGHIAVKVNASGTRTLEMNVIHDKVGSYTAASGVAFTGNTLYLRTDLDFVRNLGVCSYSTDGENFTKLGGNFQLLFGFGSTFQGQQLAIFCYNTGAATSPGWVDVDSFAFGDTAPLIKTQRERPKLNPARTTFVADNGQLLRGPYESTEWTPAAPQGEIANIKNLGFNAVHLYAESFDPLYPAAGSTAPGYAIAEVDKFVQMTRDLGLYLVITIGNGAHNGNHNAQWAREFWSLYASRYANETHVLYEIHNEPLAWGPPYLTGTTPPGTLDMEIACYTIIRASAPETPVLLFSYSVFGGLEGANAAMADIQAFNLQVFGNSNAVWTNEAIGFHGYGGWKNTSEAVAAMLANGHPCMMTEFTSHSWGGLADGLDAELTSELERLGVSWTTFQYIPPDGVSANVADPTHYKNIVTRAGLSWVPDFGSWPVARSAYGNSGQPRHTTGLITDTSLAISGTLQIEAEDFDTGGQGVAYHDTLSANEGGQYRPGEGVDIETTADAGGGYNVGWTGGGEWMEYNIWVDEPGFYNLSLRYASISGATVRVICNELDKTGSWALENSGGWQTWQTANKQIFLEFGRQKLRVAILDGAPNLNWIRLSPSTSGPISDGTYKLVNRNSGKVMEHSLSSHTVNQNSSSGAAAQQWTFTHLGAGQYRIQSVHNNDNWNISGVPGSVLGLTWWWGMGANWQRFVVRPTADGYYQIAPAELGFALEVQNASRASGAKVQTSGGSGGGAHQQWGILAPTAPDGVPTGVTATQISPGQVVLNWVAVTGVVSYTIKRATTSGGPYTSIASGVTGTSYTDSTATIGQLYYYVIVPVGANGEGLFSMEAFPARMVARLKFDESSGISAADSTGNGWNGTLVNGPVWTAGAINNSVQLDGSNDHVTLPAGVVNGLSEFTVATWVNLDTADTWARLFDFGTTTSNHMYLTPRGGGGSVRFAITTGSGEQGIEGTAPLPTGSWSHVAVTIKGNIGIIYVNGEEAGRNSTMTLTPASLATTTQNYIGKSQYNDPYLDGQVDDFRIYAHALSAADVYALFLGASNAVPESPTGLVATPYSESAVLTWAASNGASSYDIKRSTSSGGPYTLVSSTGELHFTDRNLVNGTTYYYVVSAVNAQGSSPDSAETSVTPTGSSTLVVTSLPDQDGYVMGAAGNATGASTSSTSTTLRTGDSGQNRQYKTVLSFDTSNIPEGASITSATLKMRRQGLTGIDPFTLLGTCHVDIKRNGFNGSTSLETADFQAVADASQVATMTRPTSNGEWSTGILNTSGRAQINTGGASQFRAYFSTPTNSDGTSNYVSWHSGNDSSGTNWPVLEVSFGYTPPTTSQVAWLKFDETSGTIATDNTGNEWHGTLANGGGWSAGRNGNSATLDGVDDHLTLPSGIVKGLDNFTIATWVQINNDGLWTRIFDFGTGTDNYMFLTPKNGATNVARFAIRTPGANEQIIDGNMTLPVGTWTHVAVTLAGSTGTLFINGVASGTNSALSLTPAQLGVTTVNYIGWSQFAWDAHLSGHLDDFRIFNAALSESNIAALMNGLDIPSGFTATAGDAKVVLSWDAEEGAQSYILRRATTSGGPHTPILTGFSGTSYTDFHAANGITYYYTVSAVNGSVESDPSPEVIARPASLSQTPGNLTATPGNGQIVLSWSGAQSASGYAIKVGLSSGGPYVPLDTVSALTVTYTDTNLLNGTAYYYVVASITATGQEGTQSDEATATPSAPPVAPQLISAVSRRSHAGSGEFDIAIAVSTSAGAGVECRGGSALTIVATFNKPVVSGFASLAAGSAVVGTPVFSGSSMTIPLTGAGNAQTIQISLANVTAADGGAAGSGIITLRVLQGDVNGNGSVSGSDVNIVKAAVGAALSPANFRSDLNASGGISGSDVNITKAAVGTVVP